MNESDQSPQDKKPKGKNDKPAFASILFWIILCALPLFYIFAEGNGSKSTIEEMNASEFQVAVDEDRVKRVHFITQEIEGKSTEVLAAINTENRKVEKDEKTGKYKFNTRTRIITHEQTVERIKERNIPYKVLKDEGGLSDALISLLPIAIFVIIIYFLFSRQIKGAGKGAMQFGKSRARQLDPSDEKVTFKDVAGVQEAREEVEEIVSFLRDPKKYRDIGAKLPSGCLMVGPPGTGKTLLARAIAGEAGVPFFSLSGSDFIEMFVGVGASRVRDMFEQAKKHQPCIIFIDEIDAIGRARSSGPANGGQDEREQTLNALLVEMDGFDNSHSIIVLAATNRPDVLDSALLRPGRFDRRITVDLPDVEGRKDILKVHSKKVKMDETTNLKKIARGSAGFSGADLANIINEAALIAASADRKAVAMLDLEEARDKVRWGKERKSRKMSEKELRITAYHEAGHTLVSMYCEHATPLHKVTIMPRGNSYLGATMYLPEDDSYTQSREELLDDIAISMGGRLAEDITFGTITTGASSDIQQSTNIARRMVRDWGMSDTLGFIQYSLKGQNEDFINAYSEETAQALDKEIKRIVDEQFNRAKKLLTDHQDQLILLSEELLKRETMQAIEIYELLGMEAPQSVKDTQSSDFVSSQESETSSTVDNLDIPVSVEENKEGE